MSETTEQFSIETKDGRSISCTLFRSGSPSGHLIIVSAAAATPRFYYRGFSDFVVKSSGFDVLTFDYRCVGDSLSEPIKDSRSTMSDWGQYDLSAAIDWASDRYEKIFLLGHSVAGQIFPLAEKRNRIEAAYFVATAAPFKEYWSGFAKLQILLFWYLINPLTTWLYGYLPGWAMGGKVSLPKEAAREWRMWGTTKNGITKSDSQAMQKYSELDIPIHFISFSDDQVFAPGEATQALMHKYANAKTFFQFVKPKDLGLKEIGHFGFFRGKNSEKLWSMPLMFFSQYVQRFD